MKRKLTLLKWSIACLLISTSFGAFAQTTNPTVPIQTNADLNVGPSKANAPDLSNPNFTAMQAASVFCFNPGVANSGSSFTLNATESYTEGGNTINYTRFVWLEVLSDGTTVTTNTLSSNSKSQGIVDATPGYHKYRVHGLIELSSGGPTCQSDEYDEFVIFVLPQLNVNTTLNNSPLLTYCIDAVPTGANAITFTANTLFDPALVLNRTDGYTNPGVADFAYEYEWYKKKSTDADVAGSWNIVTPDVDNGASTKTLKVTDNVAGIFNYKAIVKYKVRNSCGVYEDIANTSGTPIEVTVTNKPSKPTISITAN